MDSAEGTGGGGKIVCDSGYSNSCSNSHSLKSNSLTSRHCSSNSSGSSGYGGKGHSSSSKEDESKSKKNKEKLASQQCTVARNDTNDTPLASDKLNSAKDMGITVDIIKDEIDAILQTMDIPSSSHCVHDMMKIADQTPGEQLALRATVHKQVEGHAAVPESLLNECGTITQQSTPGNEANEFSCVVSMHDGIVMYVTALSKTCLGYPTDMWIGRAFIDFVHIKDRETLTSHIADGIAQPLFNSNASNRGECFKSTMFCRFRRYRALQHSGFRVRIKCKFDTFYLTLTFKNIGEGDTNSVYLVIHARNITSAYTVPSGILTKTTRFMTQHTAKGLVSHVDLEAIPYWGYLPQDILRKFVLDCYHPDDMPYLKQVYETVVLTGCKFKSKPYRFLTQNGDYILMDTDWSSFVNPWTRKLEFIVGHHRVLSGPRNPDIFEESPDDRKRFNGESLVRCREIQKQILDIMCEELKKPIDSQTEGKDQPQVTAFMESLVYECARKDQELKIEIATEEDPCVSERDSIMFGEISPHHDDSKSSTETPPSYNQLNYSDNIQRFFDSNPNTATQEISANPACCSADMDLPYPQKRKCISPILQGSRGSRGSGSSGESNIQRLSGLDNSVTTCSGFEDGLSHVFDSSLHQHLTETILTKHNTEMEKLMFRQHREARSFFKAEEREKKQEMRERKKDLILKHKAAALKGQLNQQPQNSKTGKYGANKRQRSYSWESNQHKIVKLTFSKKNRNNSNSNNKGNINGIPDQNKGNETNPTNLNGNVESGGPSTEYSTEGLLSSSVQQPISGLRHAFSFGALPQQVPLMGSTINAQGQHIDGSPYVIYSPYVYTPINAMAYQLWSNGVYTAASATGVTPTPAGPPASAGIFSLPQSNYQQTFQDKKQPEEQKETGQRRAYHKRGKKSGKEHHHSGRTCATPPPPVTSSWEYQKQRKNGAYCSTSSNTYEEEEGSSISYFYSLISKTDNESNGGISSDPSKGEFSANHMSYDKAAATINERYEISANKSANNQPSISASSGLKNCQSRKQIPLRKPDPPWLDSVTVTSELIYRYQMDTKNIDETLQADKLALENTNQPVAVDDQLSQLYDDLKMDGFESRLTLEEGITSSSSSGEETHDSSKIVKRHKREYSKMMMVYEEEAPFPPPPPPPTDTDQEKCKENA